MIYNDPTSVASLRLWTAWTGFSGRFHRNAQLGDLSTHTHLSKGLIYRLSWFAHKHYRTYHIAKKSGGQRLICQPSRELKAIQAWILRSILDRLSVSSACKGFEIGSSIKDNVQPHIGAKSILCVDIDEFFPSINAARVWTVFRTVGYGPHIAGLITSLCTFNGYLPQGAPTSPRLANLVCWKLDKRLMGFAGKRGIMYTRYADDLTFSSSSSTKLAGSINFIQQIIRSEGFKLNNAKTRFAGPSRRHKVTGLILHQSGFGIGRQRYRMLRSAIHHLCQSPLEDIENAKIESINGWLAFVNSVDKDRFEMLKKYIANLKEIHPTSAITLLL